MSVCGGLKGKVAIVTGSSRGIGLAIARALTESGASVTIASRKKDACQEVAASLRSAGHNAIASPCNIASEDDLVRLVGNTIEAYGRIDSVICNAAINPHFGTSLTLAKSDFSALTLANLFSPLRLVQLSLDYLKDSPGPSVTFVSSVSERYGSTRIGPYAASKAALSQTARNLAVELSQHCIRVNSVAPGLIKTDMSEALWTNPEALEAIERRTPMRRIGNAEEVANVVAFLASDSASYVTGQTIFVDGGASVGEIF